MSIVSCKRCIALDEIKCYMTADGVMVLRENDFYFVTTVKFSGTYDVCRPF